MRNRRYGCRYRRARRSSRASWRAARATCFRSSNRPTPCRRASSADATPRHADRADLPVEHHLPALLQRRRVAIGEVDHADQAGLLDRLGHLHRLGRVSGERLLAEDMLAGGDRLHGRRMMNLIRRDVRHRVELAPGERRPRGSEIAGRSCARRRKRQGGPGSTSTPPTTLTPLMAEKLRACWLAMPPVPRISRRIGSVLERSENNGGHGASWSVGRL